MLLFRHSVFLLIFLSILNFSNSEIFSAIGELESLAETDKITFETAKSLASSISNSYVNQKIAEWEIERKMIDEDKIKYITNPLNSYAMIKRNTVDLKILENFLPDLKSNLSEEVKKSLPNDDDLNGAVDGLFRLQKIYRLSSFDFGKGKILSKQARKGLSAQELFIIAEEGKKIFEYAWFAQEYMLMAYTEVLRGNFNPEELDELKVAREMTLNYNYTHDYKNAIWAADAMLQKHPENSELKMLKETMKAAHEKYGTTKLWLQNPFNDKYKKTGNYTYEKEDIIYSQVCRGALTKTPKEQAQLKCRYRSTNDFTKLARFKIEEASVDPFVVLVIDAVSEKESKILVDMARPNIFRASLYDENLQVVKSRSRVAKLFWMQDRDYDIGRRLMTRVDDMTGLSQDTAEQLQIQNYGIGGHYSCHWDHRLKNQDNFNNGNRIATVLFYLSDVEEGGATIFPYLKIRLPPRKGAAAFWYNLQPSGEGETRMRHAGCPVLLGSKWVANKWIHSDGNEFRRLCPAGVPFVEETMDYHGGLW